MKRLKYKIYLEPGKTIFRSKILRIDLFNYPFYKVKELHKLKNWKIKKNSGHRKDKYRRVYIENII